MAKRILTQAKPVMTELDRMIYQMETALGKSHVASPFPALLKQYIPEPQPVQAEAKEEKEVKKEAAPEEETKAEKPKPAKKEKQAQPKAEANQS